MNTSMLFALGLGCTLVVSVLVVWYLRRPLEKILTELCGNQDRAEFWTAFSAVTVGLMPVIFALSYGPETSPNTPPLLEIAAQLKWGLIGMVSSVVVLGWVVGRFIPRPGPRQ
jgi:hypothetical protein